jgi:hypothetical protein
MRVLLLLLLISLFLFSCSKDSEPDQQKFWDCHTSQNFDSTAIANRLLGTWNLSSQMCGPGAAGGPVVLRIAVKSTFNTDGSFSVVDHSSTLTQGNWKLKIVDANMWGLDLSVQSNYLYGRILFCENKVLFNDSYRDGCDTKFEKQK